jgi:predicted AAA+ superfamily ATPase
MAKYASPGEAVRIRACYDSLRAQLGKENHNFQYKTVKKGATAGQYEAAIEWLGLAGLTIRVTKTTQGLQPITTHEDRSSFKLYMADTGLLCMKAGVRASDILSGEAYHFKGALTENYVAQQLAASSHELFYWASSGTAELDFVIQGEDGVSAIEAKAGENARSKSLQQFISRYSPARAIRLSLKPFGSGGNITAIPLYAAFCI